MITQDLHLYEIVLEEITKCSSLLALPNLLEFVSIKRISLENFAVKSDVYRFDYIEYNGGISLSEMYSNHLNLFRSMLSPNGVIGKSLKL